MGLFKDCGCGCNGKNQQKKFVNSVMAGLLFFLVANPETFIIVRKILGNWVGNQYGQPSTYGLLLHAFIFMMIVWGMMNINKERDDGSAAPDNSVSPPTVDDSGSPYDKSTVDASGNLLPPPASVPGDAVPNSTALPPVPDMSQPVLDTSAVPHSPEPTGVPDQDNMTNKMSNLLGYNNDSENNNSMSHVSSDFGSNWQKCSCAKGAQVMLFK